jgi:hypothetical protein
VVGSGIGWTARAVAAVCVFVVLSASAASAASPADDRSVAHAGVFVVSDFPAGYQTSAPMGGTHADNLRLAKGVDGCGPYRSLQKVLKPLPEAQSPQFTDNTRTIGNLVDVFATERDARSAIALYEKSSVVGCLENLFEKQLRQDPELRNTLDDVVVNLDRQDIADLGDDSVVYEGTVEISGTDGSKQQLGIGSAVVRVGRAVDAITYSTTGAALTDVLTPAVDASVARLRSALAEQHARSGS